VLAAFEQLVEFVHTNTPSGQTPVIVGHQGFELLFKHVEQCMQRAAAATAAATPTAVADSDSESLGPTSRSTNVMGGSSSSSSRLAAPVLDGTSTMSSSRGKGRRRRAALESLVTAGSTAPGSSRTNSSKGYQHSSWPQEWMFLDTYVMAHVLLSLLPEEQGATGQALRQKLLTGLYTLHQAEGVSSQRMKARGDSLSAFADLLTMALCTC
jgi:hypothetical protein